MSEKLVYVINKNGYPLMPCKPAKARKLLRDSKAVVIKRKPFTIQLNWDCEEHVQEIRLGIDKGSRKTGFCAIGNGRILISGVINHRKDVKEKMDARRAHRRSRRNRKWYRAQRFLNSASAKRSGRIPPTTRTNIEEVLRVVKKLPLPVSRIAIEDVQIDIRKLDESEIEGIQYQKSNRLHPNLRLACLIRDEFVCRHCKEKGKKLEAHHIVPRANGGKDTIKNLLTLCEKCHDDHHAGKIKLKIVGVEGFKDRIAQHTMQGKSEMYARLGKIASLEKVFGYETQNYRKALGLEKEHDVDAMCIALLSTGEVVEHNRANHYEISFLPRQTRKIFWSQPQKGKGRVRYQVNEELAGFRKGDVVLVKGKFEKRICSIYSSGYLAFPRIKGEPTAAKPKDCRLLEKAKTIIWQ